MDKETFLNKVAELYRAMNMADSDNPERSRWMTPNMSGEAGCAKLDAMLYAMLESNAITKEEHQEFYDNI